MNGVNEFSNGDRASANLVWDVHGSGGVMFYAKRLEGAGCEKPKIEPSGVKLEGLMSSNGL